MSEVKLVPTIQGLPPGLQYLVGFPIPHLLKPAQKRLDQCADTHEDCRQCEFKGICETEFHRLLDRLERDYLKRGTQCF